MIGAFKGSVGSPSSYKLTTEFASNSSSFKLTPAPSAVSNLIIQTQTEEPVESSKTWVFSRRYSKSPESLSKIPPQTEFPRNNHSFIIKSKFELEPKNENTLQNLNTWKNWIVYRGQNPLEQESRWPKWQNCIQKTSSFCILSSVKIWDFFCYWNWQKFLVFIQ